MKKWLNLLFLIPSVTFAAVCGQMAFNGVNGKLDCVGDGSAITSTGAATAGIYGLILVKHQDGTQTVYTSTNSDGARGNALVTAWNAQVNNDTFFISGSTFDIGINSLGQVANNVSLHGAGKYLTVIKSSADSSVEGAIINPPIGNSEVTDMTIYCTADPSAIYQEGWGTLLQPPSQNAWLKNVYIKNCGTDGIFIHPSASGGTYNASNVLVQTKYDTVNIFNSTFNIYDSTLSAIADVNVGGGTTARCLVASDAGATINSFNTGMSAFRGAALNAGVYVVLGGIANIYNGSIVTDVGGTDLNTLGTININSSVSYNPNKINGTINYMDIHPILQSITSTPTATSSTFLRGDQTWVSLSVSTMTSGATNYIFNQVMLQSGSTFYVSSGTALNFNASTITVIGNVTAQSFSASTGAFAGTLANISTMNVNQVNFTSGTYAATLGADNYGLFIGTSVDLAAGTTGFGTLIQTNAGVQSPLAISGNYAGAFGQQFYNGSLSASANIQTVWGDTSKLHYIAIQEPGINATGTLFGVTKNVGDFIITNNLASGVDRTMVIGTVGNEDVIIGANNAQVLKVNKTGTLTLKAGGTGSLSGALQFVAGPIETVPLAGLMEFDATGKPMITDTTPTRRFMATTSTNTAFTSPDILLGANSGGIINQVSGFKYDNTNSGSNGGFYLPPIALPTPNSSPINPAAVHYNTANRQWIGNFGGTGKTANSDNSWMWDTFAGTLFVSTGSSTISNTTTESTFTLSRSVQTGSTNTISANWWLPGKVILISAMGWYNTLNSNTVDFKIKIGTYTIGDTGAINGPAQVISSNTWTVNSFITCQTTTTAAGVLGTFTHQGLVTLSSAPIAYTIPFKNSTTVNIDTQLSGGVNLNLIEGTTSPAESFTLTEFLIDRRN